MSAPPIIKRLKGNIPLSFKVIGNFRTQWRRPIPPFSPGHLSLAGLCGLSMAANGYGLPKVSGIQALAALGWQVTIQQALGQSEALAETLKHWGARLPFLRQQSHANSGFRFIEASHLALAGGNDAALTALTQSIDLGWREPLLDIHPSFAPLHGNPAFQAQVARMTGLINVEREKLGMALLP